MASVFVRGRSGFGKLKAERPAASLENPDILEIVVHVPDACRCRRSRTRHESLRMANTSVEVPGLTAQLDRLVHHHGGKCLPEGTPHAFVYFITIKNDSDRVVTLLGRKWMIVQADGNRVVINDGIGGVRPAVRRSCLPKRDRCVMVFPNREVAS